VPAKGTLSVAICRLSARYLQPPYPENPDLVRVFGFFADSSLHFEEKEFKIKMNRKFESLSAALSAELSAAIYSLSTRFFT
jgi:hypothetical protein